MCCTTHDDRDRWDATRGIAVQYAEKEEFRCRCPYGLSCARRATAEDLRCDWCREVGGGDVSPHTADARSGHYRWCNELWERKDTPPLSLFRLG